MAEAIAPPKNALKIKRAMRRVGRIQSNTVVISSISPSGMRYAGIPRRSKYNNASGEPINFEMAFTNRSADAAIKRTFPVT